MEVASLVCSNCGTANEPNAKFCNACGKPMGGACPVCGTVNAANAKFCNQCGHSFSTDAAPQGAASRATTDGSGPGASGAERRLVSVLFADLVGFTTASENRDAEETRELLTRYFDMARSIIERHGGTVEKFIGDAVMAVWGAPVAHEDDAERAVRTALELVAGVPSIGAEGLPLQARAGVLTGEAAVTVGATNQGMVAGDLVNTASRLQSAAAPGTVLVGEATYRAASTAIAFEPAGEQAMKGKTAPVQAWRAITVVARRGGGGRAAILEPPFVGRDDELRLLKDNFDATAREKKSRLITVIGQAGIGKSRLAWEFEKYLDGVVDNAFWHEGRSPSYGEGISYWALVEMVRRRAGIGEGDDHETVRARLNESLELYLPDLTERRWVGPRLAGLLGIEELPVEGREELFAAWRTFFQRMADQDPVIMVFTDLQWADQGMLDFVESLLTSARNDPIFVVALARPELLERRPDWGSAVRSVTRLNLEPLADEQIGEMLEGLVPGLPPAALRQIVERAEGIPLYAVETVRMLLDRELLVPEDGRYRLTGDIGSLGVAETLQALIASRLDANRPEDRALLQDASVLGQSFAVEALAAVAGVEPSSLADSLERLVRRELLTLDADPRSPERGQYLFVQAVVREVAYASLARADRRTRHLAAARYLEGLGDEETAGVLASHYLAAHEASRAGEEADALAAQARIALVAAADRAAALHSNRQALTYLDQALTVTSDLADQAALHIRATETSEYALDYDSAIDHARSAVEIYRSLGDGRGVLRASTWLGRHHTSTKLERQAITILEGAMEEEKPLADSAEYAALLAELSRVYMMSQRNEDSVATADRALEMAGPHRLVQPVVEALINKGTALQVLGRMTEAEATLRGAIAVADRAGFMSSALRARNNLLAILFDGSLDEQLAFTKEAYELASRLGHRGFLPQFLLLLSQTAVRMGDWGAWMDDIDAIEEGGGIDPFYQSGFASIRAQLAAILGDREAAAAWLTRMHEVAAQLESVMVTAAVELTEASCAICAGDWATAARNALAAGTNPNYMIEGPDVAAMAAIAGDAPELLEQAIEMLRASNYQGSFTASAMAAAEAGQAARAGRWEEARVGYRHAQELQREVGDLYGEGMAGLAWGMLAGADDPEAAAAGAAAQAFFTERGAGAMVATYRAAFVPSKEAATTVAHSTRMPTKVPSG